MKREEPIFIVGAPRSGTTLLAAMLSGHSRIACGQETHFFTKLSAKALNEAVQDRFWPEKGTALILSLGLSGQNVHGLYGLSRHDIYTFLSEREPSIRALLESLTQSHARKCGKSRWAEKTPNHLLHMPAVRSSFPHAAVVRIVRDPRDACSSMRKLPWASRSLLSNCYLWDDWYRRSAHFFDSDEHTYTICFEDLISRPEETLTDVCRFLGEPFEPQMLVTRSSGSSVISPGEPWKRQVREALDPSKANRWKHELSPSEVRAATFICIAGLCDLGYEVHVKPQSTTFVYPWSLDFIENREDVVLRAAGCGIRLSPVENATFESLSRSDFVISEVRVGGKDRYQKIRRLVRFAALLLMRRLNGRDLRYLTAEASDSSRFDERVLSSILYHFGSEWNPEDFLREKSKPVVDGWNTHVVGYRKREVKL